MLLLQIAAKSLQTFPKYFLPNGPHKATFGILTLAAYVSRVHDIEIHLSVCAIDYLSHGSISFKFWILVILAIRQNHFLIFKKIHFLIFDDFFFRFR